MLRCFSSLQYIIKRNSTELLLIISHIMKLLSVLAYLAGITGTEAYLGETLHTRDLTRKCGSNDVIQTTDFDIRNYWVDGPQGSQCTSMWSDASPVSWGAKWNWASVSTSLQSSSTAHARVPGWTRISSYESIQTSWLWRYANGLAAS